MNPYLFIFLISFIPFFETRYAIIYAYSTDIPIIKAYLILLAAIIIQATTLPTLLPHIDRIILYLDKKNVPFSAKIRQLLLDRARKKGEKIKNAKKTYFELFLFVALPLPGTGIYTGALVYYVLNLDKKKSTIALLAGGIIAMTINTMLAYGIIAYK